MANGKIFTVSFVLDSVISFCCSVNYFMLLVNITGFAEQEFDANTAIGGLAAGLYVIGGLLSRILIGKYIEMLGRKRMLIAGLLFATIMSAFYFAVSSILLLCVVRFIHGLAYGLCSTCTNDIVAKILPPERRGEGIGYFLISVTISSAIGPMLGLMLGSSGNYDSVFAIGVVMYAISFLLAFLLKVPEETLTEEQVAEAKSFKLSNLFQKSAVPLALTVMVFYFSYSGVLSFISGYSEEIDLVDAATYFYIAVAVGTLFSRLFAGRIYDVRGANWVMLPAFFVFMIGMTMYATTTGALVLYVSGLTMGVGISIVYSICQSIVVSRSPPRRYGVTTSTFAAMNDLGTGLGPSILGSLIIVVGYRDMYLICVCIAFVSFLMYWAIHGRREGTRPGREIAQESE